MADVTFIGLGLMGSALAEVAVKAGFDVVVWNRTAEKAEPLVEQGAEYVADVAAAIAESPVTIVCVVGYDTTDTILKKADVKEALNGRTLVQLTNGTISDVNKLHEWVSGAGAKYVDGGIESYPSHIGEESSMFILAGNEQGFKEAHSVLKTLAPILHYLGDDPARATAMYSAMLCGSYGLFFGVMNGVAICEAAGITTEQYLKIVRPVMVTDVNAATEMVEKCGEDRLHETEATLATWNEAMIPSIKALEGYGYNPEFMTLMHDMLNRAEKSGYAEHDLAALIEMIRPKKD